MVITIYCQGVNKKKYIYLWGNGKAKRELLFVDDFADAAIFFLKRKISLKGNLLIILQKIFALNRKT